MKENIPLLSPRHQAISEQERGHDEEELVLGAPEGVEDGAVEGVRQRVQPVARQPVRDDPALHGQRFVSEAVDWFSGRVGC